MTFLYILLALAVLLVLITVHELGHYIAGKIFGFQINEFAIGFGPAIYKRTNKKTGEVFSIRALPLGGYCAFEGEDEENPNPKAFNNMAPWKRLIVLVSGVLFNFIFGIITAAIFLMVNGYGVPVITDFSPNNYNDGLLKKGDTILAVDGKKVEAYRNIASLLSKYSLDEEFSVTVNRDGEIIEVSGIKKVNTEAFFFAGDTSNIKGRVFDEAHNELTEEQVYDLVKSKTPNLNAETNKYDDFSLGETKLYKSASEDAEQWTDADFSELVNVQLSTPADSVGFVFYNQRATYGFFESFLKAWPFCFYICELILGTLGGLFTGATALKEVGGTFTAISQVAQISSQGMNYFLMLLPMLAMNLALFNILPIPALDGAKCVFVLIEWIFRKPVPRKIENVIHTVGLFALLGLVLFFDVYHFFFAAKLLI